MTRAARYIGALVLLALPLAAPAQPMHFLRKNGFSNNIPFVQILTAPPSGSAECSGAALSAYDGGANVTFTRSTTGYCTRADGSMVLLTANQPRINAHGLLVEQARSIISIRSQELSTGWTATDTTVTTDNATSPAGTLTAETLQSTVAGGYVQNPAFTISGTTGTVSVFVRAPSGTQDMAIVLYDITAGAVKCTATRTATTTWSTSYGSTETRAWCTATTTAGNSHAIRIYPGGVAGTGTIEAWGAQAETQNAPSSYFPTAAATSTRQADVASFSPSQNIQSEGCFAANITYGPYLLNNNRHIGTDAGPSPGFTASATTVSINDGTSSSTSTITSVVSRSFAVRSAWGGTSKTMTADGVTSTSAFDGTLGTTSTLWIGSQAGTSNFLGGYIKNIRIGRSSTGCQ